MQFRSWRIWEKMYNTKKSIAYYHLPGLFEFYELYREFLPLFRKHREYFYDWCEIGSIYGAPADCIWGGGRAGFGEQEPEEVLELMQEYGISARLTFSNSLLREEHLSDKKCNELCTLFEKSVGNGVIIHSDLLLEYLKKNYPGLYFVSSTTKVLTDFEQFLNEMNRKDFQYVVPDFRLNKSFDKLNTLSQMQKDKVEFLCNECCWFGCKDRKRCYEAVSRKNLGENSLEHHCTAPDINHGYRFSKAMTNPGFIGIDAIQNIYLPMGFSNFKIEGRSLGSALILEFLLYAAILAPSYCRSVFFTTAVLSLCLIPFFRLDEQNNFCMRASIPALIILSVYVIRFLLHCFHNRRGIISGVLLILLLAVGSATPLTEFYRGIHYTRKAGHLALTADEIYTLNKPFVRMPVFGWSANHQFTAKNYRTDIFWQFLATKNRTEQ